MNSGGPPYKKPASTKQRAVLGLHELGELRLLGLRLDLGVAREEADELREDQLGLLARTPDASFCVARRHCADAVAQSSNRARRRMREEIGARGVEGS